MAILSSCRPVCVGEQQTAAVVSDGMRGSIGTHLLSSRQTRWQALRHPELVPCCPCVSPVAPSFSHCKHSTVWSRLWRLFHRGFGAGTTTRRRISKSPGTSTIDRLDSRRRRSMRGSINTPLSSQQRSLWPRKVRELSLSGISHFPPQFLTCRAFPTTSQD